MAKRPRRALGGQLPARATRLDHRAQRTPSLPADPTIRGLLPSRSHSRCLGEGRAEPSTDRAEAVSARDGDIHGTRRRPASPLLLARRRVAYAPKSIDHIHDVLSAILRSAVKWGHLQANPARGVEMPRLKTVRPKWALTIDQAITLFDQLPWLLPRTMVGLALLGGARRGELFAFRWRDFDEGNRCLKVREAVYEGTFDDPKTDASVRPIPLSDTALQLLRDWRGRARRTGPDDLMFATGSGKPISSNNVLRTWIWPACQALGLQRATWLTFRRTYSSWAHEKGVPPK